MSFEKLVGNRALVSRLARMVRSGRVPPLEIDTDALRELGCDYILSAVEIARHKRLGLSQEGVFRRDDSPWEIFLYSVDG